tara:strand:- start:901 stop:1581 length:681 start_codon:yes stop_codon:yes gene_type:complete
MLIEEIVEYSRKNKLTHIPSALSMATYVEFLFENKIIVPYKDKIVLGKPFGSQTYYLIWKKMGLLKNIEELSVGVKHNEIEFVDYGEETMGNALGVGAGIAIANNNCNVWVNITDATLQMGSTLEAIQYVGHNNINSILLTIDNNNYQVTGRTSKILNTDPVIDMAESYGWNVIVCDGHDKEKMKNIKFFNDKPTLINFITKKGFNVDYMEADPIKWHYKTIDNEI